MKFHRRLKDYIKSHPKIYVLQRIMRRSSKDADYFENIINMEMNPLHVVFNHYGDDNKGKILYIIEIPDVWKMSGFCYLLRVTLLFLYYADRMGFSPIIKWGCDNLYSENCMDCYANNAWEYFFRNTDDSQLNYQTSDLVVFSKEYDARSIMSSVHYRIDRTELEILTKAASKYLILNKRGIKAIEDNINMIVKQNKVLGVHFRGTDFRENYSDHPKVVNLEDYYTVIDKLLDQEKYEYIFVATDECDTINRFVDRYGKIVIYNDVYRSSDSKAIHYGSNSSREYGGYNMVRDILLDVYTLSYCVGLVAGLSNVSIISRTLKESRGETYSNLIIIDKGINDNMKNFIHSKVGFVRK